MFIGQRIAVETARGSHRIAAAGVGRWSALALGFAAVAGCASTQAADAAVPAAGRPMWSACTASVTAWCHRQGQGDPTLDRDCEANTTREYAALPDDPARRQYLTAHGCSR